MVMINMINHYLGGIFDFDDIGGVDNDDCLL